MEAVSGIIERIRTPLSLAGLVVLALYFVYAKILEMNVFSSVGSDQTALLISRVLSYLFWLALVAVVLGIGSFVWTGLLKKRANEEA